MRTNGTARRVINGAAEERQVGRLLRLAVRCPGCGARPALRATERAVRDAASHPPEERLATYRCHRRMCGLVYDLPAAAYQNAT